MANLKTVNIEVDTASWSPNPVPEDIQRLARIGTRDTDVDSALLHTALWTRPPNCFGFSLSDCWAWLRYQRAIATTGDLRLRQEWEDVDPHQKTVLSDELGIGFTTQLLSECLGFQLYSDTQFVANVLLPGRFNLGRYSKRGPRKSPDYIAVDSDLRFNAVECKGTQSSLEELGLALQRGVSQKSNLTGSGGTRINHSLVAGLYIPTWSSPYAATIRVQDPFDEEMASLFSGFSERELLIAVTQVAFSKHFALMGLSNLAGILSKVKVVELEKNGLPDAARGDMSVGKDVLTFETEYPLPVVEQYENDAHVRARLIRFKMDYRRDFYEEIIASKDVSASIHRMALGIKGHDWKTYSDFETAGFQSPLGFNLSLQFLY